MKLEFTPVEKFIPVLITSIICFLAILAVDGNGLMDTMIKGPAAMALYWMGVLAVRLEQESKNND